MAGPIKCETFCNRLTKCSYYKEKNTYVKNIRLLFTRILNRYSKDPSESFLKIFSEEFSKRSYTGHNQIYTDDKMTFKDYCLKCACNMSLFLQSEPVSKYQISYLYKKIKGSIDAEITNKNLSVSFSFKNAFDTEKELDFYSLNNYIYNKVHKTTNDCLVMSVPTDSYFLVKYGETDYTMMRGFISSNIKNKSRRQGPYCITCQNDCKPLFINGLDRLEGLL